jgi:hypothetical protein
MMVVTLVVEEGTSEMIDATTTRSPLTPDSGVVQPDQNQVDSFRRDWPAPGADLTWRAQVPGGDSRILPLQIEARPLQLVSRPPSTGKVMPVM